MEAWPVHDPSLFGIGGRTSVKPAAARPSMACRWVVTRGDDPVLDHDGAVHGEGEGAKSRRGSGKRGGGALSGRARAPVNASCPCAGTGTAAADTATAN